MQRRNFLKTTSLAGLTLTAVATGASNVLAESTHVDSSAPDHKDAGFVLSEATITELQHKMQTKVYTSRSIVEMYLKRIHEIDKNGPKLNAIIELNPDALKIADAMDKERKEGKVRGPMHGIPILI